MNYTGQNQEFFHMDTWEDQQLPQLTSAGNQGLTVLWFLEGSNRITIDSVTYDMEPNTALFLTEFHQTRDLQIQKARILQFNRPFYCILDHDTEIGCKGILFFGASTVPIISFDKDEQEKMETVWKMLQWELSEAKDNLQLEMLQSMLKRFLILCTRLYKNQHHYEVLDNTKLDVVREFNFLVEQHYRTKHTVADYADLLHKSPKTLSNLFAKLADKTPLQYIHDRKMLEAKRLLRYTDKSIKEVAYGIGFEDLQTFGRFFKKQEGQSPSEFRETA